MEQEVLVNKTYITIDKGSKQILLTACHRLPERSLIFRGKPLICFRCLGINIGFLVSLIVQGIIILLYFTNLLNTPFIGIDSSTSLLSRFLFAFLLQVPLFLDGTIQLIYEKYESTNIFRLLTGTLSGVGQFYFAYTLGSFAKSVFPI